MLVTGAATEIAVNAVADLLFCWIGMAREKLVDREDHSRSTVPALQPVTFPEGLLDRMELLTLCQPFDGQNIGAVCLHREHGAGLHRGVVQHHGAGAADGRFAADVRARQPQGISKIMNQQQTRLYLRGILRSVDSYGNLSLWGHVIVLFFPTRFDIVKLPISQ